MPCDIIRVLMESIEHIREPRYFETERGYAGALFAELRNRLPEMSVPDGAIVEMEYQKRLGLHGVRIRPDILIHLPTPDGGDRRIGNAMACELKRRANQKRAMKDFCDLDVLCERLEYPVVAFINIDSIETCARFYTGPYSERFHCFATKLRNGIPQVAHDVPSTKG